MFTWVAAFILVAILGSSVALATPSAVQDEMPEIYLAIPDEHLNKVPSDLVLDYDLLVQADKYIRAFENTDPSKPDKAVDDNYGGIYYDNGEYVMLFKDSSSANVSLAQGFRMEDCKYSLNELYAAQNVILEAELKMEGFVGTGIDIINNAVVVRCDKVSQGEAFALFESLGIDAPIIRFEVVPGPPMPTATIQAGGGSRNITRGSNSSASAGVISSSYGSGYIVQGHDVKINDNFGTRSGTVTGYAAERCQPVLKGGTREADATFVKLNSGHSFNNRVAELGGSYRVLRTGMVAALSPGTAVFMSGYATTNATSDFASGVVNFLDATYSWSDRDGRTHNYVGVDASYPSISGDSGGCVWIYTTAGPVWAGVQSYGGDYPSSGFAAASDVVYSLGVSVN